MAKLLSYKASGLSGTVEVPGDKSISHRALMLSSQALGTANITGLLEGEDVINTANALRQMGVTITRHSSSNWSVTGVGVGGLTEPDNILDMGNSGTSTRLMMGLVAPYDFCSFFTGDDSLRSRPMRRITKPLAAMGISCVSKADDKLPLAVQGSSNAVNIEYKLPVASAQVKSAVILAGLGMTGKTSVIEPVHSRDHTERMLKYLGADIEVEDYAEGGKKITVTGFPELTAKDIIVPGDPSSAAFLVVAALVTENSELTIKNIGMNSARIGLYATLKEMGADIEFINEREEAGEPVADLKVKSSTLKAITVPEKRAASMIDEYPILCVAASCAEGTTKMLGLAELRVKESDRLSAMENGLQACGVSVNAGQDFLEVTGSKNIAGGCLITTDLDHRIAMSFAIMGMITENPITIDDGSVMNTSFPKFIELINEIGGNLQDEEPDQKIVAG